MEDTRGAVFYNCADHITAKRPKLLIHENVRGLMTYVGGKTFELILNVLKQVGKGCYDISYTVMNTGE